MKKASGKRKRSAGRPSAESSEALNGAVLAAAAAVFEEKGFGAASIKAIAERSGASRQTLYGRFASKEALYEALMEARTSELLSQLALVLDEEAEPEAVLERFGHQLLSAFISSDVQQVHRMTIAEARTFPRFAKLFFQLGPNRGKNLLVGYLKRQVQRRTLTIPDVERAAEQFVGAIVGTVVIRSTLFQPQILTDVGKRRAWVETAVEGFLLTYGRRQ